jgi:hypothetical protein
MPDLAGKKQVASWSIHQYAEDKSIAPVNFPAFVKMPSKVD